MDIISRREFLKLSLGLPVLISQFNSQRKETRLEDLIDEDYYFDMLNIKGQPKLKFRITPQLFGRDVPIIAKGFMDENFLPLVANVANFIPGIILTVTREIIPVSYKDK